MKTDTLIAELKAKYGHVFSAKRIERAVQLFGEELEEVLEAEKAWNALSLIRTARRDEESQVAACFVEKLTGYKGGVLVVKAPVYGTIKLTFKGTRFIYLQAKADLLLRKVVDCVEHANEYDPYQEGSTDLVQLVGAETYDAELAQAACRNVLREELQERVPLLVANNVVKFTLVERKYVSTPDGKYRRVGETKTPVEFRATPNELHQGHERAANMRIHANKTAAELKKPLKGEKLWTYRCHSAE